MNTPDLNARLERLEEELAVTRRRAALQRRIAFGAVAVAAFVLTLGKALAAPSGMCPNGMQYCFAADTPAKAFDVNYDLSQLKDWLETKVGSVSSSAVSASSVTVSGAATVNGGLSVSNGENLSGNLSVNGATTSSGLITANGGVNVNGNLSVSGAFIFSGYQVACAYGQSGYMFPFCCRINIRNGQTSCRIANNWGGTSFATGPADPFGTSTDGHYSLACYQGTSGLNFPTCCRSDANGQVLCNNATNWQLTAWAGTTVAF